MKKYYVTRELKKGVLFNPTIVEAFEEDEALEAVQYAELMNKTKTGYHYRVLSEVLVFGLGSNSANSSNVSELPGASMQYTLQNTEGTRQPPPTPRQTNHACIALEEIERVLFMLIGNK